MQGGRHCIRQNSVLAYVADDKRASDSRTLCAMNIVIPVSWLISSHRHHPQQFCHHFHLRLWWRPAELLPSFFIPDSSHFFFPILVSVISCLSSTFAWTKTFVLYIHGLPISHVAIQKWKILLIFFCSSEDFPFFFHFYHSFFNISRSDWHDVD